LIRRNRPYIVDGIIAGFVLFIVGWSLATSARAQARPDGKAVFEKRCGGCHGLDRDKEGPRLGGVYGRTAGAIDSFQYSEALKKSGIKWTDQNLDIWLTDTEKLVPNNDMTFHVEKADERSAIIAYLKNPGK
jgi:cytochrome c